MEHAAESGEWRLRSPLEPEKLALHHANAMHSLLFFPFLMYKNDFVARNWRLSVNVWVVLKVGSALLDHRSRAEQIQHRSSVRYDYSSFGGDLWGRLLKASMACLVGL